MKSFFFYIYNIWYEKIASLTLRLITCTSSCQLNYTKNDSWMKSYVALGKIKYLTILWNFQNGLEFSSFSNLLNLLKLHFLLILNFIIFQCFFKKEQLIKISLCIFLKIEVSCIPFPLIYMMENKCFRNVERKKSQNQNQVTKTIEILFFSSNM